MPEQIGRYEIRRELGRGGMATVYLAFDPRFRRQVAVKVLPRQFTHDPRFLSLFQQEAQTIASLEHPAIVPVHDFGEHDDAPFLVMRYMAGGSLRDRLSGEPLPLDQITGALDRLAPALDLAHERGVVHRDIKPSNILFDDAGNPYLADFGIARLAEATQTVSVIGTPAYNSPEQVEGKVKLDGRSDIYAVGVMLFELLTGKQPYQAETPTGQMMAHVLEPVPNVLEANPDLPDWTQAVIAKAMAKDRDERFQTTADLAAAMHNPDLVASATAEPVTPAETSAPIVAAAAAETAAATAADEASSSDEAPPDLPAAEETAPVAAADGVSAQTTPPAATEGIPRNWLYIAGGALAVALLLFGIWAIFFRDGDQGDTGEPALVDAAATETAAAIAVEHEEPTDEPTDEPTRTRTPTRTLAEEPPPVTASFTAAEGDVTVINDGEETSASPDTIITDGSQITTGRNSMIEFMLEDGSSIQLGESTILEVRELATDITDDTQENVLVLHQGDILLRQPDPGNKLVLYDDLDNLIGSLQAVDSSSALLPARMKPVRSSARRQAQEAADEAVMAINLNTASDGVRISCFAGLCTAGEDLILRVGEEILINREEDKLVSRQAITKDSDSYIYWQKTCDCLPEESIATATPTPTKVPPTATTVPPTATSAPPTAAPTATTGLEFSVRITGITLQDGHYIVSYETAGYTEQLPGRHVHFFFDTVPESQAGVPGGGPWILYGGPRPFTQYGEGDRPGGATAMCALVANSDHSIIPGTGNCFSLP